MHISAVGENVIAEASFSSPFASSSSSSRDSECESPSCFSPSITSSSPKPFVSIMSRSVSTRSVRCELRRANRSSASTTSRLADPSGSGRASDVPVPSYPSERCEYAPSDPDASAGSASSRATVSDPFGASYSYLAARKPSGTPYPFVDVPGSDDFDHSSMIRASRDDENEPFALTSAMPLAYDEDAPFSVGAYGDSYVGDSYSYVGDSYVGDSYVGDSYVGDSWGTRTWGTRTWGTRTWRGSIPSRRRRRSSPSLQTRTRDTSWCTTEACCCTTRAFPGVRPGFRARV